MPKNIPQKRLNERVVKAMRLNSSASKNPIRSAGHNVSKGLILKTGLPISNVYSIINMTKMKMFSVRAHQIHLLLLLRILGDAV